MSFSGCRPNRRGRSRWQSAKTRKPTRCWHASTASSNSSSRSAHVFSLSATLFSGNAAVPLGVQHTPEGGCVTLWGVGGILVTGHTNFQMFPSHTKFTPKAPGSGLVSNAFSRTSEGKFYPFLKWVWKKMLPLVQAQWEAPGLNCLLQYPSLTAVTNGTDSGLLALGICLWHTRSRLQHMLHACHSARNRSSCRTFSFTCTTLIALIHHWLNALHSEST